MVANPQIHEVKIKGRDVIVDGRVVASIIGSRDPSGKNHEGYWIRTISGRKIGFHEKRGKGLFAYAEDARKEALANPESLMPQADLVMVSEMGESQDSECSECGAEAGQACSGEDPSNPDSGLGVEYGALVHRARQTNESENRDHPRG